RTRNRQLEEETELHANGSVRAGPHRPGASRRLTTVLEHRALGPAVELGHARLAVEPIVPGRVQLREAAAPRPCLLLLTRLADPAALHRAGLLCLRGVHGLLPVGDLGEGGRRRQDGQTLGLGLRRTDEGDTLREAAASPCSPGRLCPRGERTR